MAMKNQTILSPGCESPRPFEHPPHGAIRPLASEMRNGKSEVDNDVYQQKLARKKQRATAKLTKTIERLRQLRTNLDHCMICSKKFMTLFRPRRECMVCMQLVCSNCSQQRWPIERIPPQNLLDKAKKNTYRVCAACTTDPKRLQQILKERQRETVMALYCSSRSSGRIVEDVGRKKRVNIFQTVHEKRQSKHSSTSDVMQEQMRIVYGGAGKEHNRRSSTEKGRISWAYNPAVRPMAIKQKLMNYYGKVLPDEYEEVDDATANDAKSAATPLLNKDTGTTNDGRRTAFGKTESERSFRKLALTVRAARIRREKRTESVFIQQAKTPVDASVGMSFNPRCMPSSDSSTWENLTPEADKEDEQRTEQDEDVDEHAHDVLLKKRSVSPAIDMMCLTSILQTDEMATREDRRDSIADENDLNLLDTDGLETTPASVERRRSVPSHLRSYYGIAHDPSSIDSGVERGHRFSFGIHRRVTQASSKDAPREEDN